MSLSLENSFLVTPTVFLNLSSRYSRICFLSWGSLLRPAISVMVIPLPRSMELSKLFSASSNSISTGSKSTASLVKFSSAALM